MKENLLFIKENLSNAYSESEIRSLSIIILEYVLKKSKTYILANKNNKLSANESSQIEIITQRLSQGEPIQYIIGHTDFFGLPFLVNKHVLIPRPETEELVEWIISDYKDKRVNILDIGTGSGCIAVSLAKHITTSTVTAIDISSEAIQTAKTNALKNNVHVSFFEQDILSLQVSNAPKGFDVIVSNPPYVCDSEKKGMEKRVLDFEPHNALFVKDEDPLLFYRHIACFSKKQLNEKGTLYVEINEAFGNETCSLFRQAGFSNVVLKTDLFGKDRMIKATI